MIGSIANAIAAYSQPTKAASLGNTVGSSGSFSDTLSSFLGDSVKTMKDSEEMAQAAATGKANLQEVVVAVSNAEVMMQTVTSIRDKVVSAYQEIMRTSV